MSRNTGTQKTALLGILCAQALAVSALEGMLPAFLPLPGAKPGFSNIVTMFCVSSLGVPYALAVTLFKAVFALITRGSVAFFLSLSGGLLSLALMAVFLRIRPGVLGLTGVGVVCALAHNAGQLLTASVILGEELFSLAPLLALMSVVTGLLTGTALKLTLPFFKRQCAFLQNKTALSDKRNNTEKR